MDLSIVIPTVGRRSLIRTLLSMKAEILPSDEVLVVGDGHQPESKDIVRWFGRPYRYVDGPETHQWGHAQRNLGMAYAGGDYIAFMDDDDFYLPGGIAAIRAAAWETGAGLLLFKMRMRRDRRIIWEKPEIACSNVGSQMAVVKNDPAKFGTWRPNPQYPDGRAGDFLFIEETASLWGKSMVVFREELVAELPHHSSHEKAG